MNQKFLFASLVLLFLSLPPALVAQTNDTPTLDDAIHDLDLRYMHAADLVKEAKQISDPDKIKHAQVLYATAREDYNAFIEDIARHIQFGTKVDPLKHATDAHDASNAFSDYVYQNAPAAKAGFMSALLPAVGEMIKQFVGISGSGKAQNDDYTQKKDLAEEVRKYEWPAWE